MSLRRSVAPARIHTHTKPAQVHFVRSSLCALRAFYSGLGSFSFNCSGTCSLFGGAFLCFSGLAGENIRFMKPTIVGIKLTLWAEWREKLNDYH